MDDMISEMNLKDLTMEEASFLIINILKYQNEVVRRAKDNSNYC